MAGQDGAERITVMLDSDLAKKIRSKQAKQIQSSNRSYSFSQCLNDCLRSSKF